MDELDIPFWQFPRYNTNANTNAIALSNIIVRVKIETFEAVVSTMAGQVVLIGWGYMKEKMIRRYLVGYTNF